MKRYIFFDDILLANSTNLTRIAVVSWRFCAVQIKWTSFFEQFGINFSNWMPVGLNHRWPISSLSRWHIKITHFFSKDSKSINNHGADQICHRLNTMFYINWISHVKVNQKPRVNFKSTHNWQFSINLSTVHSINRSPNSGLVLSPMPEWVGLIPARSGWVGSFQPRCQNKRIHIQPSTRVC